MGTSASVPSSKGKSDVFRIIPYTYQSQNYQNQSEPSKPYHSDVKTEGDEENQLQRRRADAFILFNTAIENIRKGYNDKDNSINWREKLAKNVNFVQKFYVEIGKMYDFAYDVALRYQREAGKTMCDTKTTKVIMDITIDCWHVCNNTNDDTDFNDSVILMEMTISVLWNFSSCSPDVSCEIVNDQSFMQVLKTILKKSEQSVDEEEIVAINFKDAFKKGALAIIYNSSQVDQTVSCLRSLGIVDTITPYLDAVNDEVRLITLATLANIIDEKQSKVLKDKHDVIQLLLTTLEEAMKSNTHKYNGWSAKECGLCVRRLARNDANKKPLVEMGCLNQLVKLAKSKTIEEQREAIGAISVLAFDKDNQTKILEQTELQIVELLVKFKETSQEITEEADSTLRTLRIKLQKAADNTLWTLRKKLQKHEMYKHIANSYIKKNKADSTNDKTEEQVFKQKKGHVMISYDWGHQKELKKISEILNEKGFPLWIDLKDMRDTTLQEMAEAVEDASVVLVCFSRRYYYSPNCRAEAEYAFEEGKKIIPLKMDADYRRDGWLAMVITGKKFIDFSGKYPFENKMEELCQRLASCVSNENNESINIKPNWDSHTIKTDDVVKVTAGTNSYSSPKIFVHSLRKWTSDDVDNWINKHSLPRKLFGQPTGRDLAGLVTMRAEAPECFYSSLKTDLKIKSFATIDMFIEALDDLRD